MSAKLTLTLLGVATAALLAVAPAVAQEETPASSPTVSKANTDLVEAARRSKAKKKSSRRKVITNADVKKSRGKIAQTTPVPLPEEAVSADTRGMVERHESDVRARNAADKSLQLAEKRVVELERELAIVEQSYYDEHDLNKRDDVIQKQFAQTKRQLDFARRQLADARDAAGLSTPATPQKQ